MKKVLLMSVMLLSSISMFAQWHSTKHDADELKGTQAYTSYCYDCEEGSLILWSHVDNKIKITCNKGFFNYHFDKAFGGTITYATVGLYDNNDKLIKKFKLAMSCTEETPKEAQTPYSIIPSSYKSMSKKIINYLKGGTGYVRVVCSRYGIDDFDIKVPATVKVE